jgi:hypothetical protein
MSGHENAGAVPGPRWGAWPGFVSYEADTVEVALDRRRMQPEPGQNVASVNFGTGVSNAWSNVATFAPKLAAPRRSRLRPRHHQGRQRRQRVNWDYFRNVWCQDE